MRPFKVTSRAHEPKVIFAETPHQAAEIATVWQALNGISATEFTVDWAWLRELPAAERRELEEAASWGTRGIGDLRPDGGWGIWGPRDERTYD